MRSEPSKVVTGGSLGFSFRGKGKLWKPAVGTAAKRKC